MNCRDAETLLLAERDGVLPATQHAELTAHVTTCPGCGQFRAALVDSALFLKADAANVVVPDIEQEWSSVRARLGKPGSTKVRRPLAPVIWFAAPLAAAAALVFAFRGTETDVGAHTPQVAQASYVEAGDATASTMVYVDKESGWLVVWASGSDADTRG